MSASEIWTFVLTPLPVLYASNFCHELGHALCARLAGLEVGSFGMGLGRPFWVGHLLGGKVYLSRQRPFQGICFTHFPQLEARPWQKILDFSGGILAQLVLTAASLTLWLLYPDQPLWKVIAVINGFSVLVNALPLTVRVGKVHFQSDGAMILKVLLRRPLIASATRILQATRHLRPLWEAIGDQRTLHAHVTMSAMTWFNLGDPVHAGQLAGEARKLSSKSQPALQSLVSALRGLALARADQGEEALAVLDEAESSMRQLDNAVGLFLVRVYRGLALVARHETAQAVALLEELDSSPLLARRPALKLTLLDAQLQAVCALGDGRKIGRLRAEYESILAAHRPSTIERDVYRSLGRYLLAQGAEAEALDAYRRSLAPVRSLDTSLVDTEDQERFRRCQAGLLNEVQSCLQAAGKTQEAEEVAAFFEAHDQDGSTQLESERHQARRSLFWGAGLWMVDLAVVLLVVRINGGIGIRFTSSIEPDFSRSGYQMGALILIQLMTGLCALLCLIIALCLGKQEPALRVRLGHGILWLALLAIVGSAFGVLFQSVLPE